MLTPAQKLRWGAQHFSALPVPSGTTPRILPLPFLRHALRLFLPSHPPSGVLAFKKCPEYDGLLYLVTSGKSTANFWSTEFHVCWLFPVAARPGPQRYHLLAIQCWASWNMATVTLLQDSGLVPTKT